MPAVGALAAADIILLALMAAILIWAARPFIEALLRAMAQVPIVGAFIAGRIVVMSQAVIAFGYDWAIASLRPLANAINYFAYTYYFIRTVALDADRTITNALWRLE